MARVTAQRKILGPMGCFGRVISGVGVSLGEVKPGAFALLH